MKPYYRVIKESDSYVSEKFSTLKEATKLAEDYAKTNPGENYEIVMCVGLSRINPECTFWMDGVTPLFER